MMGNHLLKGEGGIVVEVVGAWLAGRQFRTFGIYLYNFTIKKIFRTVKITPFLVNIIY